MNKERWTERLEIIRSNMLMREGNVYRDGSGVRERDPSLLYYMHCLTERLSKDQLVQYTIKSVIALCQL